jgi:putative transposase
MEYRYGSHTVYNIEYHFVWVTKYRYKVLTGDVALRVRELVRQRAKFSRSKILQGVVSTDHGHILVSAPPHMAPSELMRRIKGRTFSKLFEEFPTLKKRYWGRHFWARGYFCATVGQMTEEMVQEYLAHHFEPDRADNFRTESSRRVLDPSPDFQSMRLTHQLQLVVVQVCRACSCTGRVQVPPPT